MMTETNTANPSVQPCQAKHTLAEREVVYKRAGTSRCKKTKNKKTWLSTHRGHMDWSPSVILA